MRTTDMTPDPEPSAKEQEMPTPRTDAQSKVYRYRSLGSGLIYNHPEAAGDCEVLVYVSESFARQLERDLSTLRKAAEAAVEVVDELLRFAFIEPDSAVEKVEAALASLRSELEKKTTPATPETPAPHLD